MSRLYLILLAGLLAVGASSARADGPGYKICNRSGKTFAVSYIYRHGLGVLSDYWAWTGYYLLRPNSCGFHLPTHNAANIYVNLNEFIPPSTLGSAVRLTSTQFRSSNGLAEVGGRTFCAHRSGKSFSGAIARHKTCSAGATAKYYTIYWSGIGLTHRQVNSTPHTLTID